jgi:peptide/nickel transport system substrate-binding protein
VNKLTKSVGVVVLGAALAVSSLTIPALAETKNSITVAETQQGGVGVEQISNPWQNSGGIAHHAMFRALFKANPDLTTVKPDLASGYKISKNRKTVRITLKSGLKWSDGKPITTEDVIWSMNSVLRAAQSNSIYGSAFKEIVGGADVNATNTTTISGLTAKGNVIKIKLKAPLNTLIPVLGQFMILPKHSLVDADLLKIATNAFWKAPVVAGPYKIGTFSQGNFITLVPNSNYEGPAPKISEINIIVSANLVADAKAGKLDYFTTNDVETIRAMEAVNTHKGSAITIPYYRYFIFNMTQADNPFKNVKAREALKYGVDWNRLVPAVYPKLAKVINSGVMSGMPFHDGKVPKYKFNKAKAVALLKEANFDFSKTVRLRHYYGGTPEITFMTAIAQQMIDLGMKVEMLKFQGDATTELFTNKNYDIALKGLGAFTVSEWYSEYSNPASFASILGPQPAYAAESANLLLAATSVETSKALKALQKLEQKDIYKLPLHNLQQYVFVSKRISGTTTKWGNPLYVYQNNIDSWSVN